jgi:hypothetical protein
MPYGAAFAYLFKASSTALWYLPISHHVWQPKIYIEVSFFKLPRCIYEHALEDSYPTSFVLLGDRCSGIRDFPFQVRLSTQSLDMTFSRALQLEAAKTYPNKAIQRTVLAQRGLTTLNLAMPLGWIHDVTGGLGFLAIQ